MALTSSPMKALCLREVNSPVERSGEDPAHERIIENGGNLADGLVGLGVAFADEGLLQKITHDDLRFAVEPPSGGWGARNPLPCSLTTIFAARFRKVRSEVEQPSRWC